MGNRLTKIYTCTGDDGSTGLGDGTRVSKDHVRVDCYGSVDETNALIAVVLTHSLVDNVQEYLAAIQHRLFDLGGELCIPGHTILAAEHVKQLESQIDTLNEVLPPLKEFILPGGSAAAAHCHVARAVCRRSERLLVTLNKEEQVNPHALRYLNRLSDLLFVIARVLTLSNGGDEVYWQRDTTPSQPS